MVLTQFQTKIQVFRSDNGKEYFNKALGNFFIEKGIVHQSSCNDTPQPNGIAEQKNKHLLEVARALCFTNKVPIYLWGKAILTATYLINRMPSRVLNFKTPLQVLTNCNPISRLSSTLPLKKFGCTAFVHIHDHNRGKLDPRARKCVFVGYAPTQKGYKCFDPISKKMFVTMDVTFFESKPFFTTHLQGDSISEDSDVFKIERTPPNNLLEPSNSNQFVHPNIETLGLDITTSDTFFKSLDGSSSLPSHNSSSLPSYNQTDSDTDNGNKTSTKNSELLTYSRRKHNSKESNPDPLQGQESELREEPNSSECPGNNQTDSCQLVQFISNSSFESCDDLNIPIATRKGVRSCTKHPMSNYVSYKNLSPSFFAFTSHLSSVEIPKNVQEALQVPEWKKAISEEMRALEKNCT